MTEGRNLANLRCGNTHVRHDLLVLCCCCMYSAVQYRTVQHAHSFYVNIINYGLLLCAFLPAAFHLCIPTSASPALSGHAFLLSRQRLVPALTSPPHCPPARRNSSTLHAEPSTVITSYCVHIDASVTALEELDSNTVAQSPHNTTSHSS